MNDLFKSLISFTLAILLIIGCVPAVYASDDIPVATEDKIHFIALKGLSDAILLESNGKFAVIDSGEDTNYPDGSDPKYPARNGITTDYGFEKEVIDYMKSVGVTKENLEFYLGTHPHSDHIGSADEVIREFEPERLYLAEYKDEYISSEDTLWDNLYNYDNAISAAEEVGAIIIQNFDTEAPVIPEDSTTANPNFTFGDMNIQILNYDDDYKINPKEDANLFSLGVLIEVNGHRAFLGGDIGNLDGDEDKLAEVLGEVDVLKLGHHGGKGSNTDFYLNTLNPDYAISTGGSFNLLLYSNNAFKILNELAKEKGTRVYYTYEYALKHDNAAIVLDLTEENITCNVLADEAMIYECDFMPYLYSYKDGYLSKYTGFVKSKGFYFYFDGTYNPVTSRWAKNNGSYYYFNEEGIMQSGFVPVDGKWYYLGSAEDGAMKIGWHKVNNAWHYMDENGVMQLGWYTDANNRTYYFDATGCMLKGWQTINGDTYYFETENGIDEGVMKTGSVVIGGKQYCFENNGKLCKGWVYLNGEKYYFDSNGAAHVGWLNDGGKRYYCDNSGKVTIGALSVAGRKYYFDSEGVNRTGWIYDNNNWYYANSNGADSKGWLLYSNAWYYIDSNCKMVTGWVEDNNKWYFMDQNGVMTVGWILVGNSWYYMNTNGSMATGWVGSGNSWYYMNDDGSMATGWVYTGGNWYYMQSNGLMATGTITVGGQKYILNSSGVWVG